MKEQLIKKGLLALAICIGFSSLHGNSGIKFIAGGRYDNLRMCVGSDAGVKGGPIADIMYLAKFKLKSGKNLALEIPVMRPILFAAAFQMLQFEPQVSLELLRPINNKNRFIFAPGAGVSLHYGPDYKSDLDKRGADFFAAGPFFSGLFGIQRLDNSGKSKVYGIRFFYAPLFSADSELSPGTVLGAVAEVQLGL